MKRKILSYLLSISVLLSGSIPVLATSENGTEIEEDVITVETTDISNSNSSEDEEIPQAPIPDNSEAQWVSEDGTVYNYFEAEELGLIQNYDGTFTMNGIELTTDVLSAEDVYFKIDKYIGSECINMAEGVVNVNDSGKWEFLCEPIALELTSIERYIEVNVYEDSSCQKLITKQLIIPLSFVF